MAGGEFSFDRVPGDDRRVRVPWFGHWSVGRTLLWLLLAVLVAAAVILFTAPASLVDWGLKQVTAGRVRLADAAGSIWAGQGRIVLVDVLTERQRDEQGRSSTPASLAGVVIPGTVRWQIQPLPLLIGRLQATASHESMARPAEISGTAQRLSVSGGAMQLPSVSLARLGSPWSTVRPTTSLAVSWQPFAIENGIARGKAALELRDVASALTPVRPLGAYRIDIDGSGPQSTVAMTTLEGPLRLSGNGTFTPRTGLRFTAYAEADESERLRLQSLLGLLGPREGTRTMIKIGA
ncbi:MAG: type II secretion system protein N [Lautropia sp.]